MIRTKALIEPDVYRVDEITPVNPHNFYSRLAETITDWETLAAPLTVAFCADRGRPTDPIVYYKIFLIAYRENICYDTDLAERIDDSKAIRQFLQYNLREATPDHSTIGEVRGLLAVHGLTPDELLAPIIALCADAGLVGGPEQATDSTLVPANASLKSLVSLTTGESVQEYLRDRPADAEAPGTPPATPPASKKKKTVCNADFRSTTDPDARIAQKTGAPRDMYYRITHLTDSRSHIILGVDADHTDPGEVASACPVVLAGAAQLAVVGQRLGLVSGDAGYDDAHFHAFVEDLGSTPVTFYQADGTAKDPAYQKAAFSYDPHSNTYTCPAGQRLPYKCQEPDRYRSRYVSSPAACARCPQRTGCLAEHAQQRWISRHEAEASRERNQATCHTEDGRAALRHRKHVVEPPFGHLKTYGGLALVNCRGLGKVRIKAAFGAIAWNLIQLINHGHPAPTGAQSAEQCRPHVGHWTLAPWRKAAKQAWHPRTHGMGGTRMRRISTLA